MIEMLIDEPAKIPTGQRVCEWYGGGVECASGQRRDGVGGPVMMSEAPGGMLKPTANGGAVL